MHGNAVVFRSIRVVAVVWVFYFQNYTAIVDYDKRSCYIMKLDRVKVTPPKDWIDLIQKFAVSLLSQAPLPPFEFKIKCAIFIMHYHYFANMQKRSERE